MRRQTKTRILLPTLQRCTFEDKGADPAQLVESENYEGDNNLRLAEAVKMLDERSQGYPPTPLVR